MRRILLAVGLCGCLAAAAVATPPSCPPPTPYSPPPPGASPYVGSGCTQVYVPYVVTTTPCDDPQVASLMTKWKVARGAGRKEVEKELHETLNKDLQSRLAAEENEVKRAEAHAKQLREAVELRRKNQDEIVDFRAQQLIREAAGIGWESSVQNPLVPVCPPPAYPAAVTGYYGSAYYGPAPIRTSAFVPPCVEPPAQSPASEPTVIP